MGLECGTNYRVYNPQMYQQQKISGGDQVGHFAEKNFNRVVTGAGIAGVGAAGLAAACVANGIKSEAKTIGGVISDWLPQAADVDGKEQIPFSRKIFNKAVDMKKGINAFMNDEGRWGKEAKNFIGKTKDSVVKFCKLEGVVNYFTPGRTINVTKEGGQVVAEEVVTIGTKMTSALNGLKDTIKTNWSKLPAKAKLIAGIGVATTAVAGLIYGAGKHKAGKIDQKYEDRAKFV